MTATATRPHTSSPSAPAIDAGEAIWAVRELSRLIGQTPADSAVALVLRHARRELASLTSGHDAPATVVGPFRIAA